MFKRPYYIAVALVALLTLLVLNLPSRTTARLKAAIGSIFLPWFGMSDSTQKVAGRTAEALLPKSELIAENNRLHQQNQELQLKLAQTEAIAKENERLRHLVGWQPKSPWKAKAARVIYRDPANWWKTLQIDVGSLNGVTNYMPVLSPEGFLVGRVSATSLTKSHVVLLGDPNCRVPAVVENELRSQGMIVGGGPFDGSFVNLTYLPANTVVKPGEAVVTSGLSALYPPGIRIGVVVDNARLGESGLIRQTEVKLAARLSSLEEVWVLLR